MRPHRESDKRQEEDQNHQHQQPQDHRIGYGIAGMIDVSLGLSGGFGYITDYFKNMKSSTFGENVSKQ